MRMKAGYGLAELILIHIRADPFFTEIHKGLNNGDDATVSNTIRWVMEHFNY